MGCYREDRQWSDQFIPVIKRLVGPHLLEPASFELDATEATDLLVFTARDMRIAARVRREGYAERYPWEFTIRSRRDSGAETEMSKIINGWGDWLFYGHAAGSNIARWMIVDLHVFRAALIRRQKGCPQFGDKANGDGTFFTWFNALTFPSSPPILIAASHPCEVAA